MAFVTLDEEQSAREWDGTDGLGHVWNAARQAWDNLDGTPYVEIPPAPLATPGALDLGEQAYSTGNATADALLSGPRPSLPVAPEQNPVSYVMDAPGGGGLHYDNVSGQVWTKDTGWQPVDGLTAGLAPTELQFYGNQQVIERPPLQFPEGVRTLSYPENPYGSRPAFDPLPYSEGDRALRLAEQSPSQMVPVEGGQTNTAYWDALAEPDRFTDPAAWRARHPELEPRMGRSLGDLKNPLNVATGLLEIGSTPVFGSNPGERLHLYDVPYVGDVLGSSADFAASPIGIATLGFGAAGGAAKGGVRGALGAALGREAPAIVGGIGAQIEAQKAATALGAPDPAAIAIGQVAGLAGGVAGYNAPRIAGKISKDAAPLAKALAGEEHGSFPAGTGEKGPLFAGDKVHDPETGRQFTVVKDSRGGRTALVKVVDEAGVERTVRRALLAEGDAVPRTPVDPVLASAQNAFKEYVDARMAETASGQRAAEIRAGRAEQLGGVARAAEGDASVADVLAAARTGPFRTFEPLKLSPAQVEAMGAEAIRLARAGQITEGQLLQIIATKNGAITRATSGLDILPSQAPALAKLVGQDVIDAWRKLPPSPASLRERAAAAAQQEANVFRRQAQERVNTLNAAERAAQKAQDAIARANERARQAGIDAKFREQQRALNAGSGEIERLVARASKAEQRAIEQHRREIAEIQDRARRMSNAADRKALEDAQRAFEDNAFKQPGLQRPPAKPPARPVNDPLAREMDRALSTSRTEMERAVARERALTPTFQEVVDKAKKLTGPNSEPIPQSSIEAIELWQRTTQTITDAMGEASHRGLQKMRAMLSGNIPDSYATMLFHQRNILEDMLKASGTEGTLAAQAADLLMEAELKRRYPSVRPAYIRQSEINSRARKYIAEGMGKADAREQARLDMQTFHPMAPEGQRILDMITEAKKAGGNVGKGVAEASRQIKAFQFGIGDIAVLGINIPKMGATAGPQVLAGISNRLLLALHAGGTRLHEATVPRRLSLLNDGVGGHVNDMAITQGEKSILSHLPVVKYVDPYLMKAAGAMTNLQYGTIVGTFRDLAYEGALLTAKFTGQDIHSPTVRRAAADWANSHSLYARQALNSARRETETALMLSPSMRRAQASEIRQTASIIKLGKVIAGKNPGPEAILAASTVLSVMGVTVALGKFLNDAVGLNPFEFDPSKPGFGKITVANPFGGKARTIDLFPQMQEVKVLAQSMRLLAETNPTEALEVWEKFLLSSASPPVAAVAKGAGYGYQPGEGWKLGDYHGGFKDFLLNFTPPIAQQIAREGVDPFGTPLNLIGANSYEESGWAARDRQAREAYDGRRWSELIPQEQNALKAIPGSPAANYVGTSPEEKAAAKRKEADRAQLVSEQDKVDRAYAAPGKIEPKNPDAGKAWRDGYHAVIIQQQAMYEKNEREHPYTGPPTKDPTRLALDERGNVIKAATVGGQVDWDKVDAWAAANPEKQALIDAYYADPHKPNTDLTPMVTAYKAASKRIGDSGYFETNEQAWAILQEHWPILGKYATYDDWYAVALDQYVNKISQARPDVAPETVYLEAKRLVDKLEPVGTYSKAKEVKRNQWMAANRELVEEAERWGYFFPNAKQRTWLANHPAE